MDERIESDVLRRYDISCDDAKRLKQHYSQMARRYYNRNDQNEFYTNVKFNI